MVGVVMVGKGRAPGIEPGAVGGSSNGGNGGLLACEPVNEGSIGLERLPFGLGEAVNPSNRLHGAGENERVVLIGPVGEGDHGVVWLVVGRRVARFDVENLPSPRRSATK